LGMGILCDLEGLAMSVVMPVWRKDVKTLAEAWRIRGRFEQWMVRRVRSGRSALGGKQRFVFSGFFALMLSVVLVSPAFAVEAGRVAFAGGSVSVAQGTVGNFDLVSPDAVIFKYGGVGSTQSTKANQVEIVYKNISGVSYATELAHHLGLLPAIAVGLVRKRERRHLFTSKYTDASDTVQAVIFEVSKKDAPALLEVLRARAP
jgi:hypothetical protein